MDTKIHPDVGAQIPKPTAQGKKQWLSCVSAGQ